LVFGERRLIACRDILRWAEIDVRIVQVITIAVGEYAENEIRKNFTPSERIAILETIERKREGRPAGNSQNIASLPEAAKAAGFSNRETARQARIVVKRGTAELVEAMDLGQIAIEPAALLARLPVEEQQKVVQLPGREREKKVVELRFKQRRNVDTRLLARPMQPGRAMLGRRSTLLRRLVLRTRGSWLAFLAGNTPPEPPERTLLFCASCRADTPHAVSGDSGFGWFAQVRRCCRCGRESFEVWPVNNH
jgi:hypothetical protein